MASSQNISRRLPTYNHARLAKPVKTATAMFFGVDLYSQGDWPRIILLWWSPCIDLCSRCDGIHSENFKKAAAFSPEPEGMKATSIPENLKAMASTPENLKAMASTPENLKAMASTPENLKAMASTPEKLCPLMQHWSVWGSPQKQSCLCWAHQCLSRDLQVERINMCSKHIYIYIYMHIYNACIHIYTPTSR